MTRPILRLCHALCAIALCLALSPTAGWTEELLQVPESKAELSQAIAAGRTNESGDEPRAARIMSLGASNTYGMYENLTSRGGYRGPLYDLLTAQGVRFDLVGLDRDGDFPDPDHNGYPGKNIEWFTRAVNKTVDEDREVRWAIYSGDKPVVIHFIEQAGMTPDNVILLLAGTNDIREGDDAATILRDMKALLDPKGQESTGWGEYRDRASGRPYIRANFSPAGCQPCLARARCTRTRSRRLTLHPRDRHEAITATRAQLASDAGQRIYAQRQGIEGTISQAVRAFGLRQTRYRGLAKTGLQSVAIAAAINLDRLAVWLADRPLEPTRTSRFAALATSH